jgi:hypothetical protein
MPIATKYLFFASMDVEPDKEALFNEVYDDEALIDGLLAIGHPLTPGYSHPEYPIEGRVPDH